MDKIYVLRLHNDKWYVGRTGNVERRFEQHMNGDGAKWTFLHKPINIHETRDIITEDDEDMITREYMKQFGIYNVRGGKYCSVEFKSFNIRDIKNDIEKEEQELKQKKKEDEEKRRIEENMKKIDESIKKVTNELFNPDSDLRSGRWFGKMFGR